MLGHVTGQSALLLPFAALPWLSPAQFKLEGFRSTYGFLVEISEAMAARRSLLTITHAEKLAMAQVLILND